SRSGRRERQNDPDVCSRRMKKSLGFSGSAAAHHRHGMIKKWEATPPGAEAQPRRSKSKEPFTVSQRLTAMCGGKAASSVQRIHPNLTTRSTLLLILVLLLVAFCVLPFTPQLLTRAQNQPQTQPQPTPSPTPAPSPSPSPTPPPNLHQWGAVTSFHGLPSDRTHAIAQTDFGVTWFATDGGLARYDG